MAYVGGTAAAPVSAETAQDLWVTAGGDPTKASTAAAIATAESSLVPNNWNTADPSGGSFGLWQINGSHAAALAAAGLSNWQTDPLQNAQAAVLVSNNGSNWMPWSTYTSGAYRQFLAGSVSGAVAPFVVGDTSGSGATTVYGQTLGTATTPAQQTASVNTMATGGFFGPAIDAANSIATEVFLGAIAIALLSGGILWLASTDSAIRGAAVKAAAL